jgi:hypothetical protein
LRCAGWRWLARPWNLLDAFVIVVALLPVVGDGLTVVRLARAAKLVHLGRHTSHLRVVAWPPARRGRGRPGWKGCAITSPACASLAASRSFLRSRRSIVAIHTAATAALNAPTAVSAFTIRLASMLMPSAVRSIGNPRNTATSSATDQTTTTMATRERLDTPVTVVRAHPNPLDRHEIPTAAMSPKTSEKPATPRPAFGR